MDVEVKDDLVVLVMMAKGVTEAKANWNHLLNEIGSQPFFGREAYPLHGTSMS